MSQTTYFATGCFWGAERRFWNLAGVTQTSVGYMGGNKPDPTYKEVCAGTTNHAEIVEIIFNSQMISYQRLLAEFWVMHDPTSLNQQGGDIGTQYRSTIFTTTPEQMQQALASKEIYQNELTKNGMDQIEKNPNGYDCHSSTGVAFPTALASNNG